MIRSLSLRRRCAAASRRASAAGAAVRVDRDLLAVVREPLLDERARLALLERARLLALAERPPPLALPERVDFVDDDRGLREPVPDPDLLEPPLLACGMVPPCNCYWATDSAPYLAMASRGTPHARGAHHRDN
jgi:hypothetical protein